MRVVDRLGVSNEFVSFGGELRVERIEDVRVIVFSSDAPIVAGGGHSQGWEPGAGRLSAFFARLRATVRRDVETETRISRLSRVALYAAFLRSTLAAQRLSDHMPAWPPRLLQQLRSEERRLRTTEPADWAAGLALVAEGPAAA